MPLHIQAAQTVLGRKMPAFGSLAVPISSLREILRNATAVFIIQTRAKLSFSIPISRTAQQSQQFGIALEWLTDRFIAAARRGGGAKGTHNKNDSTGEKCRTILIPQNPSVETYVSVRTEGGQRESGAEHKKRGARESSPIVLL